MRKSFIITVVLIAVALGTLLVLAFYQFQLYGRHEAIISQTEKILFQYSNIREQIIGDIVEGRTGEVARVTPAVEELNSNLLKILDNKLIPAEYKFSFLQQIDLPGLILLLRKATTEGGNTGLMRRINEESRVIGERFMLFERLVLGHAKQKLVDFQSVVIGILALVVFLVTTLMIVTYRFLIAPVMNLSFQTQNLVAGGQDTIYRPGGWEEVAGLAGKVNLLAVDLSKNRESAARYERIGACIQGVVGKVLEASDKEGLYQSVCRQILSNPDYVLVWIGEEDPAEQEIVPIVVDGSSTMSCEECQECFSALLAAQEGEEPGRQALRKGEPVVMTDVLAKAPKGPFKKTSLAGGRVDSISLPLIFNGKRDGVLTVYVVVGNVILAGEAGLLLEMASLIAAKVHVLNMQTKMDHVGMEKNIIGHHGDILSFTLDQEGKILGAESYQVDSDYEQKLFSWVGVPVLDVVLPENDPERMLFKDFLGGTSRYDFKAKLIGFDQQFFATLEPIQGFPVEQECHLLVLVAPQRNLLLQPENFKIAYCAAIGQFAGGIAHEITDMSNGIINYAQMMSDELDEAQLDGKRNLGRIIDGGERLAAIVQPLLIDQDDLDFTRDLENIGQIFQDVLLLIDPLYKRDCITVNLRIQPTLLTFKKQHVQLILFDLLKRLGEIINRMYPQRDVGKILDISVSPFIEEEKKMVLINFQFPVGDGDFMEKAFLQGSFAGMWLSRELARALGGEVALSGTGSGKGQVDLFLSA